MMTNKYKSSKIVRNSLINIEKRWGKLLPLHILEKEIDLKKDEIMGSIKYLESLGELEIKNAGKQLCVIRKSHKPILPKSHKSLHISNP